MPYHNEGGGCGSPPTGKAFYFCQIAKCEADSGRMSEPEKFLKGQLLLDSGQLRGSFFQRTVVLICEHNAEGAFGLVLNRSSGSKIGEMVVADLPEALKEYPLFLGGPVQT